MRLKELIEDIILEIKFPKIVESPIVLLLGGYQGSGKTTVIELLKDDLSFVVISPDRIRHKLIENKHAINDDFRRIVNEATLELFAHFHNLGYSLAMDNNITPLKIKEIENILAANNHNKHRLVSVYLETSIGVLVDRLESREAAPGKYKGTVEELYASIEKHGEIDKSVYDLVLNTQSMTAGKVAEKILESI